MTQCPCGTEVDFKNCCGPHITAHDSVKSAENLMRARYSAYTRGDIDFIVESTHPDTREELNRQEIETWSRESKWNKLEIVSTEAGQESDAKGKVEFKAYFSVQGQEHCHHEVSEFDQIDGKWYFTDGEVLTEYEEGPQTIRREGPKVGRNDPCPCGSGKKFKKCCGR